MMLIDTAIGSRELRQALTRIGIPCKLQTLTSGDFRFQGHGPSGLTTVVVERKTIHEMVGAITDTRLSAGQIPKMLKTYPGGILWLLVEGYYKPDPESDTLLLGGGREAGFTRQRWLYATLEKILMEITEATPIRIKRTNSRTESIHWLKAIYDFHQVTWDKHTWLKSVKEAAPFVAQLENDGSYKRSLLAQLPGVYYARSAAACEAFATIHEAITGRPMTALEASRLRQRWGQIAGIGPITARRIVDVIRGRDRHGA